MTAESTRRSVLLASGASLIASRLPAWAQETASSNTEWLAYANDLANTRYSGLDQINASNFNKLEMVWRFATNSLGLRWDADYQSTPLIAKGRILATAGNRRDVVALDAVSGELLWMHREDEGERIGTRGGPGFGLGYWTDGTVERVLYVTLGYRLISLDAKTGIPDPAFGVNGVVDLRENDDQQMDMVRGVIGLHATPLVVRNVVVIGAAPSPRVKGYVRGFDVRTGQRKWIFHTVPRKGEFGYDSWIKPGQAEAVGNSGVWAQMSADEELGLVYFGVELPSGDEVGTARLGTTLFADSIVAVDIENGVRRWHYQILHHDLWDRDVPCAGILCDIPVDGKIVKAIAQPSKQAYLYVLNRATGKPVWPIVEKQVPKGDVPGEWYSPTQPIPSKPPAFDRQGMTKDDLVDFTPAIKARAEEIASHYRMGPVYTPAAWSRPEGPWGTLVMPGTQGGANWPGGSYDPETHILYIYSKTLVEAVGVGPNPSDSSSPIVTLLAISHDGSDSNGGAFGGTASITGKGSSRFLGRGTASNDAIDAPIARGLISIEGIPLNKPPYGRITAIDLSKGIFAWQVAHGETPDSIRKHRLLKDVTIPRTGQSGILGTLTTKTLVICGDAGLFTDETGRKGARLRAYDKATGEEKGTVFIPKAQTGAAMTYMLGGHQYIVMALGSVDGAELVAFRLPAGDTAIPGRPPEPPR